MGGENCSDQFKSISRAFIAIKYGYTLDLSSSTPKKTVVMEDIGPDEKAPKHT